MYKTSFLNSDVIDYTALKTGWALAWVYGAYSAIAGQNRTTIFCMYFFKRWLRVKIVSLVGVLLICSSFVSLAHDVSAKHGAIGSTHTHIYAPNMDETLNADGTGLYNDLWKAITSGMKRQFQVVPHMRAIHMFAYDSHSCKYPISKGTKALQIQKEKLAGKELIWSQSFFSMTVHAFARPGTKPPSKVQDFKGKSVVAPIGYDFPHAFKNLGNMKLTVSSERQRATMLMSGRVDYMVSSMPTAKFVFKALGVHKLSYDPYLTLDAMHLYLACHDTPDNQKIIAQFNRGLSKAHSDGKLKEIYNQYGLRP